MPLPRYPVVLASTSPRRMELLRSIVPTFEVDAPQIDEDALTMDDPWQTAQRLAKEKAFVVFDRRPDCLVIAGDTVVAVPQGPNYVQFAKPSDEQDATRMLEALSGREHVVVTAVALRWPKGMHALSETTRVSFREIAREEILRYIASGEPMDKAGAYAIQGGAQRFVAKVEGSISNVVGLPLEALTEALNQIH